MNSQNQEIITFPICSPTSELSSSEWFVLSCGASTFVRSIIFNNTSVIFTVLILIFANKG
jgi:hypothetical protein